MSFDFIKYVSYHHWANERSIAIAEQIPHDQLMADASLSMGSPFETLRHMLDVQWSWLLACQNQPATELLWKLEPLEDLTSVATYWRAEDARLLSFVESLPEADFDREYTPSWGTAAYRIADMLIHIVNHGTNHRTELGWHFTRLGHSPGDIDFLDYIKSTRT